MNRFLKYWRLSGRSSTYQAYVISYADDFVILSWIRGGGSGMDQASDGSAWAGVERGEDLDPKRSAGKLRLSNCLIAEHEAADQEHLSQIS